jgi:hypothetical protein
MSTSSGTPALDTGRMVLLRWLVATAGFPIGGFVGHAIAGPAATVFAALIGGLIAGAIIGVGQAGALALSPRAIGIWAGATAAGLAVPLIAVTALIGQIDTTFDAVLLGALSGLAIGAGQAFLLGREGVGNAWMWVAGSAIAWAAGWLVTTAIGVSLTAGWPVYGLSGALVSQVITGVVLWKVMAQGEVAASARA